MTTCGDYNILRKLGTGGFADVFLAKHMYSKQLVALKVMVRNDDFSTDFEQFIKDEISTMKELKHQGIINLIDYELKTIMRRGNQPGFEVWYLALEIASGGDFFDYIAQTGWFSEDITRYYCHQFIDAFEYMNNQGISHRDIKPDNILLDSEFNAKIADFGWASHKTINTTQAGTLQYQAPEIALMGRYSPSVADIFSIAVVLFIMVSGHPPFVNPSPSDKHYNAIWANREDLFWKWHYGKKPGGKSFYSSSFKELITFMLQLDPISRPSLAEIRSHEWFNEPIPTHEEVKSEFMKRKALIDTNREAKSHEDAPMDEPDPSVFVNAAFRDIGGSSEEGKIDSSSKEPGIYVPEIKRATQFYSTSDLQVLYNTLVIFANKTTKEIKLSAFDYSVEMDWVHDECKISMTVNILKFEEEEKYCIEAVRSSGDVMKFNSLYQLMLDYFGGHCNAWE